MPTEVCIFPPFIWIMSPNLSNTVIIGQTMFLRLAFLLPKYDNFWCPEKWTVILQEQKIKKTKAKKLVFDICWRRLVQNVDFSADHPSKGGQIEPESVENPWMQSWTNDIARHQHIRCRQRQRVIILKCLEIQHQTLHVSAVFWSTQEMDNSQNTS